MLDFLIVYEKRSRELENASLLAAELEKRGYSVEIKNVLSLKKYFMDPKVVIAPHLYDDFQVAVIAKNYKMNNKRILDLQYEQVLSTQVRKGGIHIPKKSATLAQHIAWGDKQVEEYIKNGISPNKVHKSGSISMDLNSKIFGEYFKTRKEIAKEYKLDQEKEWVLFISSFAYTDRTTAEMEEYQKMNPGVYRFANISNQSRSIILEWFENILMEFKNKEFIYRRHPSENLDLDFINLTKKYENFNYIDDYSIRQWSRVADRFYTWFSTSIVDIYYSDKSCYILRPIEIPEDFDSELMIGGEFIKDYSGFKESLLSEEKYFPITEDRIKKYYGSNDGYAFLRICDLCVDMLNNNKYDEEYNYGKSKFSFSNTKSLSGNLKRLITMIIFDISQYIKLSEIIGMILPKQRINILKKFERENYKSHIEISEHKKRFKKIINKFDNR